MRDWIDALFSLGQCMHGGFFCNDATVMPLKLEIISEHRDVVGDDAVREFRSQGGTIGRSLESDWILPDPKRFVSGMHATIDPKGGVYYLVDLSTNGVYVNDERKPIGKGNLRRLFNGDHLHMGEFEILVSVDEGEDLEMPAAAKPTVVPDHIEQLVEEDRPETGVQLLDEDEITGGLDFESILLAGDGTEAPAVPEEPVQPLLEPEPARERITNEALFDAFLDGLQVSRAELGPSLDSAEALYTAGEILREFVWGIEKLLQNRDDLGSAIQLDQTAMLRGHNARNRLSLDTLALVKQLLAGGKDEAPKPRDAIREVCRDLLAHQDAFLEAMAHAFVDFAERLDPEQLTADFERSLGRKPVFPLLSELRYWGLYKELYPTMTEQGSGRFPHMFAQEFVNAYERHIIESQREYRLTQLLPNVKLDPLSEEAFNAEQAAAGAIDDPADPDCRAPGAAPESIPGLDSLDQRADPDDLDAQSGTVVAGDGARRVKD